jgi:hypothetical protein
MEKFLKEAWMVLKKVFGFPRPDLERRWWHRLAKVLIFLSIPVIFTWGTNSARDTAYYVFSLDPKFSTYEGDVRLLSAIYLPYDQRGSLAFAFERSNIQGAEDYVDRRLDAGATYSDIGGDLLDDVALSAVTVKDIGANFHSQRNSILLGALGGLVFYLLMVNAVYPLIAYVLAGKRQKPKAL